MAGNPTGPYSYRCIKLIGDFLAKIDGQPARLVNDEAAYRAQVIDAAWNSLPKPMRLIGRSHCRWDELFLVLRKEVFRVAEGKLALRPDTRTRLPALAQRLFEAPANSPSPSPEEFDVELVHLSADSSRHVGGGKGDAPAAVAVGIDLGTTYSVVAHLDAHGRPCSIPNAAGDLLTPSVVLFDDAGPVVGKEAVLAASMEPDRVAECAKRDMGAKAFRKKINGEEVPPEVIASLILRGLKADAERKLGPVRQAVITVPAYFDEPRRRATMDAGRLAGLDVLDIINEPTAAAIAFGYQAGYLDRPGQPQSDQALRVLVFDLGGGTFDVTILEIRGGSFKALATDGDVRLGGKDWDEKLVTIAAEAFRKQHGRDPRDDPAALQELSVAVEVAKKTLTERPKAALFVSHKGTRMKLEVTREQFEEVTAALLGRTRTTTQIVLRQAGLTWKDIDKVLLVGGAARMPMVVRMLEELAGKPPDRSVSPDEAVAHGAALFAERILHERGAASGPPRFEVTDVNSHSLGIVGVDSQTRSRRNVVLIPKNTPLPHAVTRVFKTHKTDQANVAIRVMEGESERPEECTPVGVCTITDLPPNLPQGWPVLVRYSYQRNGRLQVTAQLRDHKVGVIATFQRENCLGEEDLRLWSDYVQGGARV
jgi:molecular chaperone DnaK